MSLIACPECGEQVSNQAMRCLQCGAPGPRKRKVTTVIFAAIVLGALFIGGTIAIVRAINAGNAMQ